MRNTLIVFLFLTITLDAATPARAASTCSSVLTDGQLRDFEAMVFPSNPYSPNLGEADGGDTAQGMVKRFTSREIEKLSTLAKPRFFAVRDLRSEQDVAPLKEWLKSNPPADLPAWESGVGITPGPWDELTADDFLRVMDRSGDAGRVKTTALSTTASQSRVIGVTQHVATDSSGKLKFLWTYLYGVTLGGRLMTVPLAICQADVVTVVQNPSPSSADDEQELVLIQQQLARAWRLHDRPTLEHILAPEWSVTTPEGAKLFRAAVFAATFSSDPMFEAITTDDVTVTQFGSAAVARGRTIAVARVAGAPQTTTIRFTDFCIKRDRAWQVVASHQSRVLK
jgi:hypothetical protein